MLIMFTDFLGHNVMRHFRELARSRALPVVACRCSTVSRAESLHRRLEQQGKTRVQCAGCKAVLCADRKR